jgi:hypothetical protein
MAKHTIPTSTKSPTVKPTRSPLPRQRRRRAERAPLIPFAQSDASELEVDVAFEPETPPAVQNPRLAEDEIPFSSQPAPANDPAEPKIRPELLPCLCGLVLIALHQVGKAGIRMADLMKMMLAEALGGLTGDEVAVGVLRAVEIKAAVKVGSRYFAWGNHLSLAPSGEGDVSRVFEEAAAYHAGEAARLRAESDAVAKAETGEPAEAPENPSNRPILRALSRARDEGVTMEDLVALMAQPEHGALSAEDVEARIDNLIRHQLCEEREGRLYEPARWRRTVAPVAEVIATGDPNMEPAQSWRAREKAHAEEYARAAEEAQTLERPEAIFYNASLPAVLMFGLGILDHTDPSSSILDAIRFDLDTIAGSLGDSDLSFALQRLSQRLRVALTLRDRAERAG